MIKVIYLAIIDAIKAQTGISYVSLWNNQTAELEKSDGFALPAVLVEFDPIRWEQRGQGCKVATATIRLHILIDTLADPADGSLYQYDALQIFDIIDDVVDSVSGLAGEEFNALMHVDTIPDHNHGQIQHHIEGFKCEISDNRALKRKRYVTIDNLSVRPQKKAAQ